MSGEKNAKGGERKPKGGGYPENGFRGKKKGEAKERVTMSRENFLQRWERDLQQKNMGAQLWGK